MRGLFSLAHEPSDKGVENKAWHERRCVGLALVKESLAALRISPLGVMIEH